MDHAAGKRLENERGPPSKENGKQIGVPGLRHGGRRFAAARGYSEDGRTRCGSVQNAFSSPGAAIGRWGRGQGGRHAAHEVEALQLTLGKESDGLVVRSPERVERTLSLRE